MPPGIVEPLIGLAIGVSTTVGQPLIKQETWQYGGDHETPIPADFWPTRIGTVPTGQDLIRPVEQLVLATSRLQHSLAILPINEEHERLVDEYIRERSPKVSTVPLTRRATPPANDRD